MANTQGFRYTLSSCCTLKGSRATLTTPSNTSTDIIQPDNNVMIGSVWAVDGTGNGIQDGFLRVNDAVIDPSGPQNCSDNAIALKYFTEVFISNVAKCYFQGTATYQVAHKFSVQRASDGFWYAYNDGACTLYAGACIKTSWTAVSGNASEIYAFGESTADSGQQRWRVRVGGTTPWQRYTTSGTWVSITTAPSTYLQWWTESGTFNTNWTINLDEPS
jgi:hypothetical protein